MKEENKDVEIEDYLELDDDDGTEEVQPEVQDFDDDDEDDDEDEHERDSGEDMQPLHKIDSEKILEPESNPQPLAEPYTPEDGIKNEAPTPSSFRLMRFQEFSDSSN